MFASVLKNILNGIRPEWNEIIFELKKEELMSNLEHKLIQLDCNEYSVDQNVTFAEPLEEFHKIKSLSNFVLE